MKMRLFFVGLLASCAGLSFGGHYVEYGLNLSLGPYYIEDYITNAEPQGIIDRFIDMPDYGFVAGKANVGYGVNKAYVSLRGINENDPLDFAYGFATSLYFDTVLIDDPNLNGTPGTFDANLFVAGDGFFNVSQSLIESLDTQLEGFWHAVINVWTESDPNWQSVYYAGDWIKDFGSQELIYVGDPLNTQQQTQTFNFIYGENIYIQTFIQTDIRIDNQVLVPGTFDSTIDLANSAYWGGMREFRDLNGNPVSGFGYSSSSGFNYLSSVPEPSALAALGIGVLVLARARRRR